MSLKTVRVRLYPNKEQQELINKQIGCCRFVYNNMLALKSKAYKKKKISFSAYDYSKHMTNMKKRDKYDFLNEVFNASLKSSLLNLDQAYKGFFKSGRGYPKFKSKHDSYQSFQVPRDVKINNKLNKVKFAKVGYVKMKGFRKDFVGIIKTCTVTREAGQYHMSILIDDKQDTCVTIHNGKEVGIDVGCVSFLTDSNGVQIKPLDLSKENVRSELRSKQLSNKKKGSKNRAKAKRRLQKQHLKIRNKRKDFLHKISKQYSENQTVVIEDLNIQSMTDKRKSYKELNRNILQQSWGTFFGMLEYKLKRNGGKLVKVNPAYTSQECSKCKAVDKNSRKSQAVYKCTSCGYETNADINAAINILNRSTCGYDYSKTANNGCGIITPLIKGK